MRLSSSPEYGLALFWWESACSLRDSLPFWQAAGVRKSSAALHQQLLEG